MAESKDKNEEMSIQEQIENLTYENQNLTQQIKVYQEMQKLEDEATFRYNLLAILQEANQVQKLNGQTLVNIGKLIQMQIEPSGEEEEPELTEEEKLQIKIKELEEQVKQAKSKPIQEVKEVPKKKGFWGKAKKVGDNLDKGIKDLDNVIKDID